jgi:hypothetical protein
MKYSKMAKLLFLAWVVTFTASGGVAWGALQFENDTLSGASNGEYVEGNEGSLPQVTFYYHSGYEGEVVAGIKITASGEASGSITFTSDDARVSVLSSDNTAIAEIADIAADTSAVIKVRFSPAKDFGTGKKLTVSHGSTSKDILLIGQPITVHYNGRPDTGGEGVSLGEQMVRDYMITSNVSDIDLYLGTLKLYKMAYSDGRWTLPGTELSVGGYIVPNVNGTGGIKITAIGEKNTFTLASDGPIAVDPANYENNVVVLGVTASEDLRIGAATGPKVAGYEPGAALTQIDIHREHRLHFKDSTATTATVTATVGSGASPSFFEVVTDPAFTDTRISMRPNFSDVILYEGGKKIENSAPTKTYNGLTIAYTGEDQKITVTGIATSAGTKEFDFSLPIAMENAGINSGGNGLSLIVAIAPYSGGQAPEQEVRPGDPPAQNETIQPEPEATVVDDVQTKITDDLSLENVAVVGADSTKVTTGTSVLAGNESIRAFTTYAVAVNQPVAEGGAVVLATDLSIPTTKTLDGTEQEKAKDLDELTSNYSLNKYFGGTTGDFANGNAVDLLQAYKNTEGLFTLAEDGTLKLNAIVVVIDDKVPAGETDIQSPLNNSAVGVKVAQHSDGGNYLYIFDGNKDGNASDPIVFARKEATQVPDEEVPADDVPSDTTGKSSGGGCNTAGMAGLSFLLFSLIAKISKKHR